MKNPFRNDLNINSDGFVGLWVFSMFAAAFSIIAVLVVWLGGFENHLYFLWALAIIPALLTNVILFSNTEFYMEGPQRINLYKTQKNLPEEVSSKIGILSDKEIMELSSYEAETITGKLLSLEKAYQEQQEILRLPKVRDHMQNIDSALESYKESNKSLKELV